MSSIIVGKKNRVVASQQADELLRRAGDPNFHVASQAQYEYTEAINEPLRDAILAGDIVGNIFEERVLRAGENPEYAKSFITPDNQHQFDAYVFSHVGRISQRQVAGDQVLVPTYPLVNALDCKLSYLRDANWNVMNKMRQVLLAGHVIKKNRDGFAALLSAGAARNVVLTDSLATAGVFSPRLVSLLKTRMARLGGGNTASVNRRILTDLFLSVESSETMRSWDLTQVDDMTRREIFLSDGESALTIIYGVRIHPLVEMGAGYEYDNYVKNTLGVSLGGKTEFCMGIDMLHKSDSFVHPVREQISVRPDPYLHRELKYGEYSIEESGWGVLDNRNILLGAI